jgi:hypothetical protein
MTLIDTMHKPCDSKMNEMFNKKIKIFTLLYLRNISKSGKDQFSNFSKLIIRENLSE